MIKRGFTLMEILISMAIVGIVAAVLSPTVSKMIPDRHKATVLKYYSAIAETTANMLDNDYIYYSGTRIDNQNGFYEPTCIGLRCTQQPLVAPYDTAAVAAIYTDIVKYPNLLGDMLNLERIQNGEYEAVDGTNLRIVLVPQAAPNEPFYNITINFEPNDAGACSYVLANPNCTRPDVYIFRVNMSGTVTPGDAMTAAYLANPKANRRDDLNAATALLANF